MINQVLLRALVMMIAGCGKVPCTLNAETRGGIPPRLDMLPPGCVADQRKGGAALCYPVYKPTSGRTSAEKQQPKVGVPTDWAKPGSGRPSRRRFPDIVEAVVPPFGLAQITSHDRLYEIDVPLCQQSRHENSDSENHKGDMN